MKKSLLSLLASVFIFATANGQSEMEPSPFTLSGYLETYYIFDFNQPQNHDRPDFLYAFDRHNEVSLNIGFVQAAYDNGKIRGKLALMAGTYANANLAAEPATLRNIYEANVGVKLSKTKNLWADAGVFASHIGFGSAVGADCWNMTRSLAAENSPYFLSGVKLTYTSDNEQWLLSGLLLNGWQRIQRVEGNQTPAFGHQIAWMPNENITLNSSSFVGSDTPDVNRRMRYFHNFYGQFQLSEKFGLIAGFDFGAEQKAKGSNQYHSWYTPVLIGRFAPNEKIAVAARVEYYADKGEVIVATATPNGFQVFGYSLNVDVRVMESVLWRLEGRAFNSRNDAIFLDSNELPTTDNHFLGTSLSLAF